MGVEDCLDKRLIKAKYKFKLFVLDMSLTTAVSNGFRVKDI